MDVDILSIPAGKQDFPFQSQEMLRGEAKKFKDELKFSDALECLRVLIQNGSDPTGTFDALLQFCVCSLLKDSSDVRFFDSFVRKMSQKRFPASELMEKGMQYLKMNCYIESLVLFSSACALYCQEKSDCEEVPTELRDCFNKIDDLFHKMASLCRFHWTICETFILIHERIMLHTSKISSPSPRHLVQTRCRLNVSRFWFELGEFVKSEQSYLKGIEALDLQFNGEKTVEGYAELLEGLGIVESIINTRKQAKATLKSCLKIMPNTYRRKQVVEEAMQELKAHKSCRPAISRLKKQKDEYRSLVTKKKYENAERQAKKLLKWKENEVQEFEALLMVSECEMLCTRQTEFTGILELVGRLHLSADELFAISEARIKSNVVQAYILQKSAMSLSKLDLENGQEMVERMMKISKVVLPLETPNKLLTVMLSKDILEVVKEIQNLPVECETELVRVVGEIYSCLANLHADLEDKQELETTSGEGLDFMELRLGEEASNYFSYSRLLYFRGLALSWNKCYPKAIDIMTEAASFVSLLQSIADDEKENFLEKITTVIEYCRTQTTVMKKPLKRSLSLISGFASLTGLKNIQGGKKVPSIPETIKGMIKSQTKHVVAIVPQTSDPKSNKGTPIENESSEKERSNSDETQQNTPFTQKTLDSLTSAPSEKADSGAIAYEETEVSGTGADTLAVMSSALDEILSLEEQHKSTVTHGIIPTMYKAMERMEQLANINPDGRKASCLLKIGQAYMAIGEFQKAFEVANTGLDEDKIFDMTRTNLLKLAADASYRLGDLDVAVSLYSRAYRDLESLIPEDSNGALKSRLLYDISAAIDSKHRKEKKSGSVSVTKIIGPTGGKIGTDECTIYFPKGALNENTPVNITLELRKDDIPRNKFPVAPLLKLSPKMNLNKPAKVRTTVWCSNTRSDIDGEVYYRDQNNSSWKCVEKVTLGREKILEFPIKKFCEYECVVNRGSDVDYYMQSWLFINERTGVLRNSIFPCSHPRVARDGVLREMETFGFRAVCSIGDLTLARHDEIKVKLQARSAQHHIEHDEQIVEVSEEVFYPSVPHIMEFQFPEDSEGRISFNHTVEQNRQGQCIRTETHNDRVLVESTRPSSGVSQVNFLGRANIGQLTANN